MTNAGVNGFPSTTGAPAVAALAGDPLGFGFVATAPLLSSGTGRTWAGVNDTRFVWVMTAGTISKIGLYVETSSGNISVGVYRKTGSGRTATPGALVATSGAVACPGSSAYAEVSLGCSVQVSVGDYLAMSCDNTTASFICISANGNSRSIYAPLFYGAATSHPLLSRATGLFGSTSSIPFLVGVAA